MAYVLPAFNLACNIWHSPVLPPVGAPAVVTVANLALGQRVYPGTPGATNQVIILFPKLTDIRDAVTGLTQSIVELPAGSGRFYGTIMIDDAGKGFPNEHRVALCSQLGPWPVPMP